MFFFLYLRIYSARLNASFELGEFASAIPLAEMGEQLSGPCTESGWSQLGNHLKMQFAEPSILSEEECKGNPEAGEMGYATFCAGEEGTGTAVMCPGYTGSPLACTRPDNSTVLAGLQSFTYVCFEAGAPSVYAEIAGLRDWVDYIMDKFQD